MPAGRRPDLRGQLRRAAGQAPLPPPRDPGRMSVVVLEPCAAPAVPLEAPEIRPDAFAALSEAEIARLPVWHGNEAAQVGDFFRVRGGRSADVRIAGHAGRVKHLGNGMAGGRLVIEGNAGAHVGAEMTGGRIIVEGDAGPWAGAEMRGGVLEIRGNAGSHLAAAYAGSPRGMNGGLVLVHGSAGDLAAERMRRGIVAVAGDAGDYAGAAMLAGTLLVFGRLGRRPGAGLRRRSALLRRSVPALQRRLRRLGQRGAADMDHAVAATLGLNERAARIADAMAADADALRIAVSVLPCAARVIDCGIAVPCGLEAGRLMAEACMGGLGRVQLTAVEIDGFRLPGVHVHTDQPAVSCLASQYAG